MSVRLIVRFLGSGVVHFYAGLGLQSAEGLVASDHDFVALLQAFGNFDIGDAGDAGFHRPEYGFLSVDHEYALDLVLLGIARGSGRRSGESHARTASLLLGFLNVL